MRYPGLTRGVAAGVLAALVAVLVPTAPAVAQTIELRIIHHQADTGNRQTLQNILREFEAQNPGIKVKDFQKATASVLPETQAAAAAGRPYDVALVLARLVLGARAVTNARPFSEAPDGGAFMKNYSESLRPVGKIDGEYYMAPHSFGTPLLYYNKDVLEEAGLDPNKPPRTMQEMAEMARQVTKQTDKNGTYIISGGLDYGLQTMMRLAGSPYLDGTRAAFDTPQSAEVMQFWADLVRDGLHPVVADREGSNIFASGKMAFNATTSGRLLGFVKSTEGKFRLGVAKFPAWKDAPLQVPNSGAGMMVMSQDPKKKEAAFRLVAFMSQPRISNHWSRSTGYMPVSVDPLADPKTQEFIKNMPHYAVVVEQKNQTVATALWPGDRVVEGQTVMKNLLTDLWEQKGTAAELIPKAAADVSRILAESTAN